MSTAASPTAASSPPAARPPSAELYENESSSAHAGIARALTALRALASLDAKLAAVLPMLEEASIQVREGARELEHYRDTLDIDAGRQDEVERRLAAIEDLARKHRVTPFELPERTLRAGRRARVARARGPGPRGAAQGTRRCARLLP